MKTDREIETKRRTENRKEQIINYGNSDSRKP